MARARTPRTWVALVAVLVIAGGAAAGVAVARSHHHHRRSARPARAAASRVSPAPGTSGRHTAAPSGSSGTPGTSSLPSTATPSVRLVSASPAPGALGAAPTGPIVLHFSGPLDRSTTPSISPPTPGSWAVDGSTMTFTPAAAFVPLTTVTIQLPAGVAGPTPPRTLTGTATTSFRVRDGSILRLDQLLALLDYAPVSWQPAGTPIPPGDVAAQTAALYAPPAGHFAWRQSGWPSELTSLWDPGHYSVMTRGLVMSFQADHGLYPNGHLGPGLWRDLLVALAHHDQNQGGYNFALASKHLPESLTIWHDGAVVLHAKANTGIAVDPTPDGVFPVDTRLRRQIMRGTNPDGTHYADPVQYVAYFHKSDAVHYIPRATYGFPQSLGCVELSLSDARTAWPYLAYGTLVDVVG